MDTNILRAGLEAVKKDPDSFARRFYDRLLGTYPQVRPLFQRTDFTEQRAKLVQSVATIVALVERPEALGEFLEKLGQSHVRYGVQAHQYAFVCSALTITLAETYGTGWSAEVADTWCQALETVSRLMIEAQGRAAA